ncbi:DUF4129 domain-containing protein [Paenibacillus sp. FA6]|uniref:DUF4129 domain-containing protein n=1 Tax=Paenibacillus sp. FA6 TaxID=3413029 RepID=UPI003F6604C8
MNLRTGISRFRLLSRAVVLRLAAFYSIILIISQYILHQPTLYIAGLMWVGGMIVAIISYRRSKRRKQGWEWAFPLKYQLVGIGCTLVLSMFSSKLSLTPWEAGSLYIAGVISLSSWLLRLNSEQVNREVFSESLQQGPLKGLVKVNRNWSIVILVVMLVFGAFTQLSQGFYWLWIQFVDWLNNILSNLNEPVTDNVIPEPEIMENPFMLDGETTTEAGSSIWMNILYWIVGILLVLIVVFALYKLVRFVFLKIGELLAKFGARAGLPRIQSDDHNTYMDKVEKIETIRHSRSFRRKKNPPPEDIHGKVRYYYQSMVRTAIKQGLVYSTSQTPNEVSLEIQEIQELQETPGAQVQKNKGAKLSPTVVQDVTSLYNEVRYGGKVIQERQLESVIDSLKK